MQVNLFDYRLSFRYTEQETRSKAIGLAEVRGKCAMGPCALESAV